MRRNTLNFIVNIVTLLVAMAMVATGLLLKFVMPPGSRGGQGLQLWGFGRHSWGDLHFALSVALGGLLILHVALHWTWVCTVVSGWLGREGRSSRPLSAKSRWAYGAGFFVTMTVLVVAFLWVAQTSVTKGAAGSEGSGCGCGDGRNAAAWHSADTKRSERAAPKGRHQRASGRAPASTAISGS